MRLANVDGRLAVLDANGALHDVEQASDGRLAADPSAAYAQWDDLLAWSASAALSRGVPVEPRLLGPPVPAPRQIFAVALNYAEHAAEGGRDVPDSPLVFTKFATCLAGPVEVVELPTQEVDWEVELVVMVGREGSRVTESDAWSYVAGLTVGQDLSARDVQRLGPAPQFSLAKSFARFGPTGPWLVTPDELTAGDLLLECELNGETVQRARTSEMLFSIPRLIAYISRICRLLPGDLLFTGTPAGVGSRRTPPRFLQPGDTLTSRIEGIGEIVQTFVASSPSDTRG